MSFLVKNKICYTYDFQNKIFGKLKVFRHDTVVIMSGIYNCQLRFLSFALGWIYDQWYYYPASLYAGALFIFISCIVMLWPWYKVRQGSWKRARSTSSIEDIKSEQPLTDYLDPHAALKKHVFLSIESLHSFV